MQSPNAASNNIYLEKGGHRNQAIFWMQFSGRRDWLSKIKQLPEVKYSKTIGHWYLPYHRAAFDAFTKLDIPYIHSGTHAEVNTASDGEPALGHDSAGISATKSSGDSVSPSTGIEVTDIHSKIKVEWTAKGFILRIPYKAEAIAKVKKLEGAWWNQKFKVWRCKNTLKNLYKIQKFWHLWSEPAYQDWHDKISQSFNPCKITFYNTPKYAGKISVKLIGYGANHTIVKAYSGRHYDKESSVYLIDGDQEQIQCLIDAYKEIGYTIENRLKLYNAKDDKPITTFERVEMFLKTVRKNKYSTLKTYAIALARQNLGFSTIKQYTSKLEGLLDWVDKTDLKDVTDQDVNNYLAYKLSKNVGYSVINQIHSAIKAYSKHVNQQSFLYTDKLERPQTSESLPYILSIGEIERIMSVIENAKHLAIVYTLYGTGVRRGELLNIKISDIYWDRNQIIVRNGKGGKDRVVNFSAYAKDVMSIYFDHYMPVTYLFESTKPNKKYSTSSVAAILKKAAKKANITKRITPHVFRHSFATHQVDIGIALPKIQELLGHKDIRTTMIYTHMTTNDMRAVGSPLDKILGKKNNSHTGKVDI